MKKTSSLFLTYFFFIQSIYAQDLEFEIPKNNISIELGGPSLISSINYSRLFILNTNFKLNVRVGLGSNRIKDFTQKVNPDVSLPIGVNLDYAIKRFKKSCLSTQIGIGNTISSIVQTDDNYKAIRTYNNHGFVVLGLFLEFNNRFFYGINYTPLFVEYEHINHWASITVGYLF